MELTKAQIELMSLDSQLMETIQQKIRLSQELERWQVQNRCKYAWCTSTAVFSLFALIMA